MTHAKELPVIYSSQTIDQIKTDEEVVKKSEEKERQESGFHSDKN